MRSTRTRYAVSGRSAPVLPPQVTRVRSWAAQVDRFHGQVLAGDERGCRKLVDRLDHGGVEPIVLCEQLFAPTLRRIGDDWQAGRVSVAEEHRASVICEELLARVTVHPTGRPRGIVIVATPQGEQHRLPATMAATVLRAAHWQVQHLGPEVPGPDLIDLATDIGARLVVLSLTYLAPGAKVAALVRSVERSGMTCLAGQPGASLTQLLAMAQTN